MVVTRKKTPEDSLTALAKQTKKFAILLRGQKEKEAAEDLLQICKTLETNKIDSEVTSKALDSLLDAFDGDHELSAYTHRRDRGEGKWGDAENLYVASTQTLNLLKRLMKLR